MQWLSRCQTTENSVVPYYMSPESANNSVQSIHNILTVHELSSIMAMADYTIDYLPTSLPAVVSTENFETRMQIV